MESGGVQVLTASPTILQTVIPLANSIQVYSFLLLEMKMHMMKYYYLICSVGMVLLQHYSKCFTNYPPIHRYHDTKRKFHLHCIWIF